ncbi:DUF5694 domain-containing protein [Alteromonas ponticola]|uniref:TraB/GumN family protein n=1 Tax=Alteromonas ponticola TaxID=2720613 RepID=A0ABX1R5P5_9ALTE|nr:DUF5694 domain-containing protein [Alteromonas ponticola]NMH60565.1 hypothetical protein [Alteromonas ponticola]
MKFTLIMILLMCSMSQVHAQVKILPVGVFHFTFPNLDAQQVIKTHQIDVLEPEFQKQIEQIVNALSEFEPDYVVVEHKLKHANALNRAYLQYLKTGELPGRSETYQLGFRIANKRSLNKVHGVDTWGKLYQATATYLSSEQGETAFNAFYNNPPDKALKVSQGDPVYKERGIAAELIRLNQPDTIRQSLNNYLVGHFKYATEEQPYFGADFETGRWFNRNLRILRNIQQLPYKNGERILLIYGAGHLNVLNYLFDGSSEFERVSPLPFLQAADDIMHSQTNMSESE